LAVAVSTAVVSGAATVSTVTVVLSVFGAVSVAFGAQDANANAITQNNNTFFIFYVFII
jgi:hypothetical protein